MMLVSVRNMGPAEYAGGGLWHASLTPRRRLQADLGINHFVALVEHKRQCCLSQKLAFWWHAMSMRVAFGNFLPCVIALAPLPSCSKNERLLEESP